MRDGSAGFTLLEVLVSLVIVGLLMAALSGGFRFSLLATGAEARLTEHNEDLVVLDQTFRRLIGHASAGSQLIDTPFRGAMHEVAFTALLSGAAARTAGGLADVTITVDLRHRLVVVWQPHAVPTSGSVPIGSVEVLADGVDHVDFQYGSPVPSGAPHGSTPWRPVWREEGLPDLVRLHLVPLTKGDAELPDIVAVTHLRDRTL